MSADNGVYVIESSDGFRVAYAQAINNIDYYPEKTEKRREMLRLYFGNSKLHSTKESAFEEAKKIADEVLNDDFCPILEYGIVFLGKYEDF